MSISWWDNPLAWWYTGDSKERVHWLLSTLLLLVLPAAAVIFLPSAA
jgi:hypothetical protein